MFILFTKLRMMHFFCRKCTKLCLFKSVQNRIGCISIKDRFQQLAILFLNIFYLTAGFDDSSDEAVDAFSAENKTNQT